MDLLNDTSARTEPRETINGIPVGNLPTRSQLLPAGPILAAPSFVTSASSTALPF